MKKRLLIAGPVAAIASFVVPGVALGAEEAPAILETPEASINAMWVIVAGILVMFMQAGFLLLEVGFSRAKNAGAGVAKVLVNFSIASLCYWAVGFALAFGGLGEIAGTHGFLPRRRLLGRRSGEEHPLRRDLFDQPRGVHVLQVRVLRRLPGDRLGRHP